MQPEIIGAARASTYLLRESSPSCRQWRVYRKNRRILSMAREAANGGSARRQTYI